MFRRLERRVVGERISQGFGSGEAVDVDGFLKFSLQVQNRRKSRMGHAFEHHLAAVFRAYGLAFEAQVKTEQGNTADFLFPGRAAYLDTTFPTDKLTMLAAKSTCKDRWRQVLPEASRIWPKHLVTLEPAISSSQLDQMRSERLQLVIPQSLHETYERRQAEWLMTTADFIELVKTRVK